MLLCITRECIQDQETNMYNLKWLYRNASLKQFFDENVAINEVVSEEYGRGLQQCFKANAHVLVDV